MDQDALEFRMVDGVVIDHVRSVALNLLKMLVANRMTSKS